MTLEALQTAVNDNQWLTIAPELMLAALAALLLVLEIFMPKKGNQILPFVSVTVQFGILAYTLYHYTSPCIGTTSFSGLLRHNADGQFMRIYFLLASALVTILSVPILKRHAYPRTEFLHITLVVAAAMMLLVQANNLLMLFVALETVTIGFYILVAYLRRHDASLEAGAKYLIIGSFSSGILLFGLVLIYGATGTAQGQANPLAFESIRTFLQANPSNFLASTGIVLTLAGIFFKIGAVPFQFWIPDVYQGAPTPTTAYLAISSKAAGLALLLNLIHGPFAPYAGLTLPIVATLAVLTLIFGNLAALTQSNIKRLLGLSGISHAGFLLLGIVASYEIPQAISAIRYYLLAYLLASFAIFAVMTQMAVRKDDADQTVNDYANLYKTNPFLSIILIIGVGSLAGIPPLAGFMGKLFIFITAFEAKYYLLLAVAVAGVVISIYYYFGWIAAVCFKRQTITTIPELDKPAPQPAKPGFLFKSLLALLAAATLLMGFFPGPLGDFLLK